MKSFNESQPMTWKWISIGILIFIVIYCIIIVYSLHNSKSRLETFINSDIKKYPNISSTNMQETTSEVVIKINYTKNFNMKSHLIEKVYYFMIKYDVKTMEYKETTNEVLVKLNY